MQLRLAEYLQLAVCFACCTIGDRALGFSVALLLCVLKGLPLTPISRIVHLKKVFTGSLVGGLAVQFLVTMWQQHLNGSFPPESFLQPIAIVSIVFFARKANDSYEVVSTAHRDKYVVPTYLIVLSLLQNQQSHSNGTIQLIVFGASCLLLKLRHRTATLLIVALVKLLLIYQCFGVSLSISGSKWKWLLPLSQHNRLMLIDLLLALQLGSILLEPSQVIEVEQVMSRPRSQWLPASAAEDSNDYVEMKELRRSLLDKQSEPLPEHPRQHKEVMSDTVEQSQSYNIVLLLPYFLFKESLLELPLYVYIISLQYVQPPKLLKYVMISSASALYVVHQLSGHAWVELLSISLVLILHWRVNHGDWLADIRALWLRWCFVLVLIILCWFGLKQVNLFHLGLMTVLLLFITLGSESGSRSFRNRNWKYLLTMFNVFVISRYLYSMVDGSPQTGSILELIGLSKNYNTEPANTNFNLLPYLMLTFVVLQYWTYKSRTYQQKSKNVKEIFRSYLVPLRSLSFLLQIVYYKSILWGATVSIIVVLLMEDFAITSSALLVWTLALFVLQICQAPPTLLNKLWLILSRLIAFQIIVRYFFEFTKYRQLYDLLESLPFFQFLVKYQRLLGLSVDYPSTLYLYAITKFQLTIALDLVMVFLAFLAMEYLSILIRGRQQPTDDHEDQKAHEIYHNYVLFSITHLDTFTRIRWILRTGSRLYLSSFYLLLAVYACFVLNAASLLMVMVFCLYYQKLSSFQHQTLTGETILSEISEAYQRWLATFQCRTSHLLQDLDHLEQNLVRSKLRIHQALRKYISILLAVDLFLVYSAQLFAKKEAVDLFQPTTVLSIQWLLYLYGTSRHRTGGYIRTLAPYLLFCILLIIELKVCKFVERLADMEYRSRPSEVSNSPLSIEPKLHEAHSHRASQHQENIQHLTESMELSMVKQVKSETSMRVSLRLAANKLIERCYVMLLVLCSTMRITPESVPYVLIAFLLNHYGTKGLLLTFRCLSLIVILEYSLALLNFQNAYVYEGMPPQFTELNSSWNPVNIFGFSDQWIDYMSFAKNSTELAILLISVLLIASLPLYCRIKVNTSKWLVGLLSSVRRPKLRESFHLFFKSAYRYLVVLNPLYITLISVALYLSQFTLPNLFLCTLSVAFLLREYLADELSDREHSITFWKAYFRLLQGTIVVFLLGYYVIATPIYHEYCTELLCSPMSARSKLTKALLVFLFQLGIDLLKSSEYNFHMDRHHEQAYHRAQILKIAIAQRQNDRRLEERFRILDKRSHVHSNLEEVMDFLQRLKRDPNIKDIRRELLIPYNVNFMNSLLEFLANLIDPLIMKPLREAQLYVQGLNLPLVRLRSISKEGLASLPGYYDREFMEEDRTVEQLLDRVETVRKELMEHENHRYPRQPNKERDSVIEQLQSPTSIIPHQIEQQVRQTVIVETAEIEDEGRKNQTAAEIKTREERRYRLLLTIKAVLSNWQLLIFLVMIVEFTSNCGLLMAFYPISVFLCGMEQQYMAGKIYWRVSFVWTSAIIVIKYLVSMKLIALTQLTVLIGEDPTSLLCEFVLLAMILCQSFLLHSLGLFKETVPQVQPMKIALIRNMLFRDSAAERLELSGMLRQSYEEADNFLEWTFWKGQHKHGYDYSTFITSVELICLAYCFLFYDRMFLDANIQINSVVEYNQFTGGMVGWLLLQLFITLLDRFIVLLNLRDYGGKWDCSLILKYMLQCTVLGIVHYMMVWFIPQRSASHTRNFYSKGFYTLYCVYFMLSSMQVRDGIDRTSRGFMDRYVWYNGYVYTALRVVPFLFEFKVFSDWFVSKTTMRLFDWIKFQDLFGRLFVAKCNSLFLQGKRMGSKIEGWKKWLMGCPLLFGIVLLIFGPLVLFSSLNPLAATNGLVGGSAYLTLRINSSNEYPLFVNSHISSIQTPTPQQFEDREIEAIIDNYNIEKQTIQLVSLESYSDTYWEISEGSERRLLDEPDESMWELLLTIKFYRQHTSATPIFTLNSLRLPTERVQQFKQTLLASRKFFLPDFYQPSIRLDNNNGLHVLGQQRQSIVIYAERGKKSQNKYWVIEGGLTFLVVSDKYSQAIFGYSVMGFYISIILVVANYFRFIFQGGANLIGLTDIPMADPLLTICEAIYLARLENDLPAEDRLYWTLIDLVRSPDTVKLLTGSYLEARLKTKDL